MHWPKWTKGFETRLRILLLGIAVLASVALPYAIIRNSANETLDASSGSFIRPKSGKRCSNSAST